MAGLDIGANTAAALTPGRRPRVTLLMGTLLATCASPAPGAPATGRDRYREVVPLSKHAPPQIEKLACFGTIEWTVGRLPFVAEGPHAGISGAGMAVHGGRIFLAGGFIPAGDETDNAASRRTSRWAHRYDPATGTWGRLPDMPARREYTRALATEEAVYVIGGACQFKGAKPAYRPFADCFRLSLDAGSGSWEPHSRLNVPRTHMAVGRLGPWLIVAGGNEYDADAGGYAPSTIRGLTEAFDTREPSRGWQLRSPLPAPPRGWTASASLRRRMFVLGGLTIAGKQRYARLTSVLSFDPWQDRWSQHAEAPVPISGWEGAAYADRYVILIGGVVDLEGKLLWNDVPLAYDAQLDRWLRVDGPLPPGSLFNDAGVCIVGDTIHVVGAEGPFGSHFNYFLVGKIRAAP